MKHLFITLLLISSIFSQQTIAVLDFEGIGVSQEEARALSNRFGSEFLDIAGNKYILVERQAMGEILKEQGLQQSGCVSSECAVEVGAALGAQLIIIGSISQIGSIFSVNARMLDVETAQILKSINYDQVGDIGLLLTKGMREAAVKMSGLVGAKYSTLDYDGGLYYLPQSKIPYSGDTFDIFDDGSLKLSGLFNEGKKHGLWTEWYKNGQKKSETTYKVGKEDGLRTKWYKNGQKNYEMTYKIGKLHGLTTNWNKNGQKNGEATYKYGKVDGKGTYWYENGQKEREGTYKNGKEDGLWTYWYENGQKRQEATYKDGKLHGLTTNWYENGQKSSEGIYKGVNSFYLPKEVGKWTKWYESGQKRYEGTYKDGELIDSICWDEDGNECECSVGWEGCK